MMASTRPSDTLPNSPVTPAEPSNTGGTTKPPSEHLTRLQPSNFIIGFDWVLTVGVLILAFLSVSFAVRNADFWQHIATGRLLIEGGYSFGKDPFSSSGADRTWVNHSWFFDLLMFWLFKAAGGPGVVVAKSILMSLIAGLLIAARKPGQAVWGSVIFVALAIIAAAPRLELNPKLMSYLFIAGYMYLFINVPSWFRGTRLYVTVGVISWFWVNLDQWFFVGPCLLAAYVAGQFLLPTASVNREQRKELLIALGVSLVVSNLTPNHIRVWTLPVELTNWSLMRVVQNDPELSGAFQSVLFTNGGISSLFGSQQDQWLTTYSLAALLIIGMVSFIANFRQFNLSLLLVWLLVVGLTLIHIGNVPILLFVTAPIAALNTVSAVVPFFLKPKPEGIVRLMHTTRLMSRLLLALIGVTLITISYPGWLHPDAAQRRWKWDLEPNQSMVETAEYLQQLRENGQLPPEAKLLNLQPELGSYLAWYAPKEKAYIDDRLGFHSPELTNIVAIRKFLSPADNRGDATFPLRQFLDDEQITHVVSAYQDRNWNQAALAILWQADNPYRMPEFVIWRVHGRAVTLGRTKQTIIKPETLAELEFNPKKLAFKPTKLLETPSLDQPIIERELADKFVSSPPMTPAEIEEAFVLFRYRLALKNQLEGRQRTETSVVTYALRILISKVGPHPFIDVTNSIITSYPLAFSPESMATTILAVRATRRAIAASPNHPDAYGFLGAIYPDAQLSTSGDFAELVAMANTARMWARMPVDINKRLSSLPTHDLAMTFLSLRQIHVNAVPARLDLALIANQACLNALDIEIADLESGQKSKLPDAKKIAESRTRERNQLDKEMGALQKQIEIRTSTYNKDIARFAEPLERATVARREGLALEAINELSKANDRYQQKLKDGDGKLTDAETGAYLAILGELIELYVIVGRTEEAIVLLDTVDKDRTGMKMISPPVIESYIKARVSALRVLNPQNPIPNEFDQDPASRFRFWRFALAMITGDYDSAIAAQQLEVQSARDNLKNFVASAYPNGLGTSMDPFTTFNLSIIDLYARLSCNPMNPVDSVISWRARYIQASGINRYRYLVINQSDRHTQLGLIYLEQGDIKSAKLQFKESLKGPKLSGAIPSRTMATNMLKVLEE